MTTVIFHRASNGAIITTTVKPKPKCLSCRKEHPTVRHPRTWICDPCKNRRQAFRHDAEERMVRCGG
jgi:uncharacterized Zn-finger protein